MAQNNDTSNLKNSSLDLDSIESLSFKDKELIYNGAIRLCSGFLSHPSYWGSTGTAFLRLGILAASRKSLILTAALIAQDCGLLNNKKLTLKIGDDVVTESSLVDNLQDDSDPKSDVVSQNTSSN